MTDDYFKAVNESYRHQAAMAIISGQGSSNPNVVNAGMGMLGGIVPFPTQASEPVRTFTPTANDTPRPKERIHHFHLPVKPVPKRTEEEIARDNFNSFMDECERSLIRCGFDHGIDSIEGYQIFSSMINAMQKANKDWFLFRPSSLLWESGNTGLHKSTPSEISLSNDSRTKEQNKEDNFNPSLVKFNAFLAKNISFDKDNKGMMIERVMRGYYLQLPIVIEKKRIAWHNYNLTMSPIIDEARALNGLPPLASLDKTRTDQKVSWLGTRFMAAALAVGLASAGAYAAYSFANYKPSIENEFLRVSSPVVPIYDPNNPSRILVSLAAGACVKGIRRDGDFIVVEHVQARPATVAGRPVVPRTFTGRIHAFDVRRDSERCGPNRP